MTKYCAQCGKVIPPLRIQAAPRTVYCRNCAEKHDTELRLVASEFDDNGDVVLVPAKMIRARPALQIGRLGGRLS